MTPGSCGVASWLCWNGFDFFFANGFEALPAVEGVKDTRANEALELLAIGTSAAVGAYERLDDTLLLKNAIEWV